MQLFKYLPQARVDVLARSRIRFTQPLYFNDPFEFSPTIGSLIAPADEDSVVENAVVFVKRVRDALEPHTRFFAPGTQAPTAQRTGFAQLEQHIETMFKMALQGAGKHLDETWRPETRERVGRQIGVLSLSAVNDSLLMWAHYAESHKGFAIGLDSHHPYFDQRRHGDDVIRHLAPVAYSEERPAAILLNPALTEAEQVARLAATFFLTKSIEWQYEREWRMLRSVDEASEKIELSNEVVCLYELPSEAVTDVIVGCRMSGPARDALLALRSDARFVHTRWSEACINERLFKVDIRPLPPA